MENDELKNVFRFLSAEEKSHLEMMKAWRDNAPSPVLEAKPDLFDFDKIFDRLSKHFNKPEERPLHYYQAYEKALAFEKETIAFYNELLRKSDPEKKKLILKIVEQEKKHAQFLTNLLEFLRHPGEWLENAEWRHLDEF